MTAQQHSSVDNQNHKMARIIDDKFLTGITELAKLSPTYRGVLKRYGADQEWTEQYCIIYQNLLIEFEDETCFTVVRVITLETYQAQRMEISTIEDIQKQNVFYLCDISQKTITMNHDKVYEALDEISCSNWMKAINNSSYSLLKSMKDELEYRNVHLLSVVESERHTKWKLEEFAEEQRRQLESLRKEIPAMISKKVDEALKINEVSPETEEIRKIRKIQTSFRALICRRRWHNIVQDYIRSPHAESMRKRNQVVFQMAKSEEEYVDCLSVVVSAFYRPCKMAASSSSHLITHDEVNSIFLNSETLMFLHQIFLKGLQSRMESWPKIILGDLFDMLLPMLSIYQEYVRNHHFSLQMLIHCKQQSGFRKLLKTLEEKPMAGQRSLETFLTYPMHRIPKYITTLQQLLALTPYDHVERVALEHSQSVLEELSLVMHDEISETENIRKNLSIERLFIDGCDFLLDSNEVFIRQGILLQITTDYTTTNSLLHRKKSSEKRTENVRHCFLFSRKLLIATRVSGGKLQLVQKGKIMLDDVMLIEDIADEDIDFVRHTKASQHNALAFKLLVSNKHVNTSDKIILLAATASEKAAWTSDISQCTENLKEPCKNETVAVKSRRSLLSIRSDPSLITDGDDIKYSRALDSCRLPRIRYGSIQRLLSRLLDVRFLSVEFLNTFLTTHSVFTTSSIVLETIFTFYHARKQTAVQNLSTSVNDIVNKEALDAAPITTTSRIYQRKEVRSQSLLEPIKSQNINHSYPSSSEPSVTTIDFSVPGIPEWKVEKCTNSIDGRCGTEAESKGESNKQKESTLSFLNNSTEKKLILTPPPRNRSEMKKNHRLLNSVAEHSTSLLMNDNPTVQSPSILTPVSCVQRSKSDFGLPCTPSTQSLKSSKSFRCDRSQLSPNNIQGSVFKFEQLPKSHNSNNESNNENKNGYDVLPSRPISPRSPSRTPPMPGVVVASSPFCNKRSSIAQAAVAFAAATAGAIASPLASPRSSGFKFHFNLTFSDDAEGNVVTNRVLKILKHWMSKQPETIKKDKELRDQTEEFLLALMTADDTVASEKKLAATIVDTLMNEVSTGNDLPDPKAAQISTWDLFANASTLQIAEQMTLMDHLLLKKVPTKEFLLLSWMKEDKEERAPNILKVIARFNMTSKLVSTEIVKQPTPMQRAHVIEKWVMVADMCRCLQNFNGVLAIITSFTSSAIFRLKKTWEKVSKQTHLLIEKLKTIVSTDGRFRNMKEALKCCDLPCVPYLGFYLTDLAFIEERASIAREEQMVNFGKMTMITNVIQEIEYYQTSSYTLERHETIMCYLLDEQNIKDEEEIYQMSLDAERRSNSSANNHRIKFSFHFGNHSNTP